MKYLSLYITRFILLDLAAAVSRIHSCPLKYATLSTINLWPLTPYNSPCSPCTLPPATLLAASDTTLQKR